MHGEAILPWKKMGLSHCLNSTITKTINMFFYIITLLILFINASVSRPGTRTLAPDVFWFLFAVQVLTNHV